jgi:hypothetical protein
MGGVIPVLAHFNLLSWHLPVGTEENHRALFRVPGAMAVFPFN